MFNHIRHFSSVFVSLRDFQLITQISSENITSRLSRCIYVNGLHACRITHFHCAGSGNSIVSSAVFVAILAK